MRLAAFRGALRRGRALAIGLSAVALIGSHPAPAAAQWFGMMPEGPIPPALVVRSLMRQGFLEIDRPRFTGSTYVVEGVNARGLRVRLVIDAFDGAVVSRKRLDAPLLPPREVGRAPRPAPHGEPFRRDWEEDDLDFPPPPSGRRVERAAPPFGQPQQKARRNDPVQKEARRTEPNGRQPGAAIPQVKAEKPAEATATPSAPERPVEAKPEAPPPAATAAIPASPLKDEAQAPAPSRAALPKQDDDAEAGTPPPGPGQRSVRVIEGVTPMTPRAAEPEKSDTAGKPDIVPPASLE